MDNTVYLYIPREKLLNTISRKHRDNKFKKLYYYKNKKLQEFNGNSIQEEIYINKKDNKKHNVIDYQNNKKKQLIKKINYNKYIKNKINSKNFVLDFS